MAVMPSDQPRTTLRAPVTHGLLLAGASVTHVQFRPLCLIGCKDAVTADYHSHERGGFLEGLKRRNGSHTGFSPALCQLVPSRMGTNRVLPFTSPVLGMRENDRFATLARWLVSNVLIVPL